jgi:hypothetical protein
LLFESIRVRGILIVYIAIVELTPRIHQPNFRRSNSLEVANKVRTRNPINDTISNTHSSEILSSEASFRSFGFTACRVRELEVLSNYISRHLPPQLLTCTNQLPYYLFRGIGSLRPKALSCTFNSREPILFLKRKKGLLKTLKNR